MRTKIYGPGDRVLIYGQHGLTGRVVEVIRRSDPVFHGYLVDVGAREPVEVRADLACEPDRPLLRQWQKWARQGFGDDFVAWLTDTQVERLRTEYLEENPAARKGVRARYVPRRIPGFEPMHLVTIAKTTERYQVTKSNGSCLRTRERHTWWVRCLCGFHAAEESSAAAKALKEEHEKG